MTMRGVILAAGYGTRFLPITRTIPKEMLPLVDRPCLDLVVQELIEAGIRDILVITSRRKKALDDWFDRDPELEAALQRAGRDDRLARATPPDVNVQFIRQRHMGGTGHALRLARDFARGGPVIVAFPDDLFLGAPGAAAQLAAAYHKTGCSVLGAYDLGEQPVNAYGVIELASGGETPKVRRVVEKPDIGEEPSSLISVGRYLYTPAFFEALEASYATHTEGEFYPMEAIEALASRGEMVAQVLTGTRHDTGTPLGYLQAVVDHALAHPEVGGPMKKWLQERLAGS
jgi:UTP--glucose-1-phosphate uridylyltransferase